MSLELNEVKYTFCQEGNCVDNEQFEILELTVKSNLGHLENQEYFFVIKTEQWSFDSIEEFRDLVQKVEKSILTFKAE